MNVAYYEKRVDQTNEAILKLFFWQNWLFSGKWLTWNLFKRSNLFLLFEYKFFKE